MRVSEIDNVHPWDGAIAEPHDAERIRLEDDDSLRVPDRPIVPFIQGDGIGPEIAPAMLLVAGRAVERAYGGRRALVWTELLAGGTAEKRTGERMPPPTIEYLRESIVGIKGPLGTPVGGGGRSLNGMLRQSLDFYSAVRPVAWLGQPTPLPDPGRIDCAVFRENSDDVYMGIEYFSGTDAQRRVATFLRDEMAVPEPKLPDDCGITVKPMSERKTKRHVRKGLRYALRHGKRHVALVGKGNILKATEGAFIAWGFEVAGEPEFASRVVTEGEPGEDQVLVERVITDQMLMQLVLYPERYDVVITQNLNGDYISDLASALVGGPGFVPSGNIGDGYALFESTHGTALGKAGKNTANPLSLVLSGAMLVDYLGWSEAAGRIYAAVRATLGARTGTPDIAAGFRRDGARAEEVSTSEFAQAIAERL